MSSSPSCLPSSLLLYALTVLIWLHCHPHVPGPPPRLTPYFFLCSFSLMEVLLVTSTVALGCWLTCCPLRRTMALAECLSQSFFPSPWAPTDFLFLTVMAFDHSGGHLLPSTLPDHHEQASL